MAAETNHPTNEALEALLAEHPQMEERIYRQLLMTLHTRGIVTIDGMAEEARKLSGESGQPRATNPNESADQRFDDEDREAVHQLTRTYACQHLTADEVADLVNFVLKREEAQSLGDLANLPSVSYRVLVDRLRRFCALPLGETQLDASEMFGLRVALARHFMSDELKFIGVVKNHMRVRDYEDLTQRIIGSDTRMGRLGGKAAGMLLAHRIVEDAGLSDDPEFPVAIPDSYYLRSDVIDQFLELNRLTEYHSQKYKSIEEIRDQYPLIKGVFRNSTFPVEIVQQLRSLLERVENHPLIVRSSSLLEDRFSSAFTGKYSSIFVPNQGPLEVRLRALLGAIGEVYASTLAPDPILYRRNHNLLDYDEEMAVLIQKVVGQRMGQYFLPAFAGIAFSRNEYCWSPRIQREHGLMRVVMGLGTRAVDRVGGDYPRMVALGAPTLRPESNTAEILRHSQRTIDAINLVRNRFDSIDLPELLSEEKGFVLLDKIVSIRRDGELGTAPGTFVDADPSDLCITFDKLLNSTPFAARMLKMLQALEAAFGSPVDVEFACDGKTLYMLQCRAQHAWSEVGRVELPKDIPNERVIFTAERFVRTALVSDIEYVVYVPSGAYHAVDSNEKRLAVARVIGRVNSALDGKRFILMGPGRWGTNDVRLGVKTTYADISNASMLIEIARERDGYVPEVSFGTHFFQDLVENDIAYLPLYPDEDGVVFNDAFMRQSPNVLADLVPKDADFAEQVRVIHVPDVADAMKLRIAMDGDECRAVAYLTR